MQTGRNVGIYYKPEVTFNTPLTDVTAAKVFRANAGAGLKLGRAEVKSNEIRADGMTTMSRLGSKTVTGSHPGDLSVGTFDDMLEALLRSTWVPAVSITTGDITSATFGANTIVLTSGDPITLGVRIGDVIRIPTSVTSTNNNRNLRVTGLSATTITVAETLTVDASADTTVTLTIMRKLKQDSPLVRRSFCFEEYDKDIDQSEVSTGIRVSSIKVTGQPDGMALIEVGLVGADLVPKTTAESPFFTSPTATETIGLVFADATIRLNGVDIASPTAFELMLDISAKGQPGLYIVTPDIFENNLVVSGSVSVTRSDLSNLTTFAAETEFELHLLLVEPATEPKPFVSLFIPRVKLTGVDKNFGGDGAMVEALPFTVGAKGTATGYDNTMITACTSAS